MDEFRFPLPARPTFPIGNYNNGARTPPCPGAFFVRRARVDTPPADALGQRPERRSCRRPSRGVRTSMSDYVITPPVQAAIPVRGSEQMFPVDRKSTRLNSSHSGESRMPSSA